MHHKPLVAGGFLFLLLSAGFLPVFPRETVTLTQTGRRIQLDGFLLDWVQKGQRVWRGSGGWLFDAVTTPEGVAGYFHCGMVACSTWTFYIDPHRLKSRPWVLQIDTAGQSGGPFYRAQRTIRDGFYKTTFEWIIPWDSLILDSSGAFEVHVAGESGCRDTLPPFMIQGARTAAKNYLPPRFGGRLVLIVALLVIFIGLQVATRKKRRRTGSPRRSA